MAQVGQGRTNLQVSLIEQELRAIERPTGQKQPVWPWLVVLAGMLGMGLLSAHAYTAYATITRIDASSKIASANPFVLFQDVATNGPRVGSNVDASSRATYTRALEQFVLDGTGVVLGLVLTLGGLFVRANL